jgi:DNA-binding beta-propeller fold protein YncE
VSTKDRQEGTAARARVGVLLATLVGAAIALLAVSAPAFALSERGHVFSFSFGSAGGGSGQFSRPAGVAVNESTGDVYVVDRGNSRVERFDSSGKFISAWGYDVGKATKERKGAAFEVCTTTCFPGLPGKVSGKGQFGYPEAIAIDNSSSPSAGDVYVVASVEFEGSFVDKYSPTGNFLRRVTKPEETTFFPGGRIYGVSVDAKGLVWVAFSEEAVTTFTAGEPNKRVGEEEVELNESELTSERPGFAVDSQDDLYANFEPSAQFVEAEEGEGEEQQRHEEGRSASGEEPCEKGTCIVAKFAGVENPEAEVAPGAPLIEGFAAGEVTSIATDLSNDNVYVDEASRLSAFKSDGTLIQRFGEGDLTKGSGVAVNSKTGTVYVADSSANEVDVFSLETAGRPKVTGLSAVKTTPNSTELVATIDPSGSTTSYVFKFSTSSPVSCSSNPSCEAPIPPGSIAASFSDQTASATVTGLEPGTTYHYTVSATNASGAAEDVEERSFTTPLTEAGFSLADGRAWELVTPPEKNGAGIESLSREGGVIQSAPDGEAITYIATGPDEAEPEGNRSPTFLQGLATRGIGSAGPEWTSKDITITNQRAQGVGPGEQQEYLQFSPDLSLALVEPFGLTAESNPPLSPEATEKTIYVRHNPGCGPPPSTCYTPVVTATNATSGEPFGAATAGPHSGVRFVTATPDFSHVVLSSPVPLTTEAAAPTGRNLYEWTAATRELRLVNLLPPAEGSSEELPASFAEVGLQNKLVRHAISEDGSRVVFNAGGHLYVRDTSTGRTVQVDAPEAPLKPSELTGPEHPVFQTASTDTTKIFFTDEQRLTSTSTASRVEGRPDLYEFDLAGASPKLFDLTTGAKAGETADVRGFVIGASEETGDDAATIYFVANGVLSETANSQGEKASKGGCVSKSGGEAKIPGATCNLYVERLNNATGEPASPSYIASLSGEDLPDWEAANGGSLREMTARVSPNGQHIAFMSDRSLTGYDNRDAGSTAGGARDEEVFEYGRESGALVCASCNPTGARPSGVLDQENSGEGLGLLVDRPQTWDKRWLAGSIPGWTASEGTTTRYQSRYLSNTGRLFFDSADALVPLDTNGKEDVYEFESAGEGSCATAGGCVSLMSSGTSTHETAFLDASANGNDVFLLSAAPLTAQDHDTNFDIYDSRVCTSGSPCVSFSETTTPICLTADTCKSSAPTTPVFSAPASSTTSSSGNIRPTATVLGSKTTTKPVTKPLTRKQKLAKALKTCRKLKKKSKRAVCEKRARKKYGTKQTHKKAAKKGSGR